MKSESKRSLKGSVLFTVVSVMSILIIMLTGTLVLAASVNNRAHKSYTYSQTQVTARTAVDSIITAINSGTKDTNDIQKSIANMSIGSSFNIDVDLGADTESMGTITSAKAECVNSVKMYDSTLTPPDWIDCYEIVISATATLGGESSTFSATILNNPEKKTPQGKSNGFISMGDATLGSTNYHVSGGTAIGLQTPCNASIDNNVIFETDFTCNGNLTLGSSDTFLFNTVGSGVTVFGDMNIPNTPIFSTTYSVPASGMNYNQVPYVFVSGNANFASGWSNSGSVSNPVNFYLGSMSSNNTINVYGDIILNDPTGTSSFTGSNTKLYNWVSSTVNRTNDYDAIGGSVYSRGNLTIGANDMNIQGSLRIEGNLEITPNNGSQLPTVGGDVVVGGTLSLTGTELSDFVSRVSGTIYCNNIVDKNGAATDPSVVANITQNTTTPIPLYYTNNTADTSKQLSYVNYLEYYDNVSATTKKIFPVEFLSELLTGEYCLTPATDAGAKTVDDYLPSGVTSYTATPAELASAQNQLDEYNNYERFKGNVDDTAITSTIEMYKREYGIGTLDQEKNFPTTIDDSSLAADVAANVITGDIFTSPYVTNLGSDTYELSRSCTWDNVTVQGKDLIINPGTTTLWIKLKGNNYCNWQGSGTHVLIDDSQGGSVKFLFDDGTLSLDKVAFVTPMFENSSSSVMDITSAGIKKVTKSGTVYFDSSVARPATDPYGYLAKDELYAPKVFFYSTSGTTNELKMQNDGASVVGFIRALSLRVNVGGQSRQYLGSGSTYTDNSGSTIAINKYGLVGYCIADGGSIGNDWALWYINPDAGGGGGGGLNYESKTWKIASYNFG